MIRARFMKGGISRANARVTSMTACGMEKAVAASSVRPLGCSVGKMHRTHSKSTSVRNG